ncbi:uncharacterized protein LOC111883266 isoform X4 [Lactuca sativa]|uniref:uncharacterized protein LOC111883266 isoform X4 n=1 Tax=Lactuca sativa TaxID=4236 RepID=UPI0022AEFEF1|nr:uncharacterized protein LOC111883266 isoform X4 [Lactuca sativa]
MLQSLIGRLQPSGSHFIRTFINRGNMKAPEIEITPAPNAILSPEPINNLECADLEEIVVNIEEVENDKLKKIWKY